MSYNCALHPQAPITHFCESCLDLVCQKCITKQPHSGTNHTIKQIKDAANVRKNMYAEFVELQVNTVRSEAQKKISEIENEKKNIEKDRKVIQKDLKIEFEAINNRLEDKQSQALIVNQTQIKQLQNFVHTYDDLTQTFDSIYQNPQGLLISYKTLDSQLKRLQASKHTLSQQSAEKSYELTRQFETILKKSQTLTQYEARNQFTTKMIQKYIDNHKKLLKQTQQNCQKLGKQYQHSYNNIFMKAVSDQTAKICIFCGFPFTIQYVNEMCSNNRTYKMNCVYAGDWENIIPKDVRGTKRHYWIKSNSTHRKRPKMQQHSMVRRMTKKHYYNSLIQLQQIKYVMKKHEIQTGKSFEKIVQPNDTNKNGFISKVAFVYTMNKVYQATTEQIQSLMALLSQENGINYVRLKDVLDFPTQDYLKFVALEEQAERAKPVAPQSTYSRFKY